MSKLKSITCKTRLAGCWLALVTFVLSFALTTSQQTRARQHATSDLHHSFLMDQTTLYDTRLNSRTDALNVVRQKRSNPESQQQQLIDTCQSKMEVITPYFATNAKGKLRKLVNSELMQQAIQVETCSRSWSSSNHDASRCNAQPDCGCEQKYKWHRLLVMDPKDAGSSKGLFMDWFLFPSSCVCRCKGGSQISSKQFLKAVRRSSTTDAYSPSQ